MDKLKALNIHIDEDERLRLVSDPDRKSSQEIATKSQEVLSQLRETLVHLDDTIRLMEQVEKHNQQLKPLKLATIIQKLDGFSSASSTCRVSEQ